MSESQEYGLHVQVKLTGYDAARYAVVEMDSVVQLQVRSTGLAALLLSQKNSPVAVSVDMRGESVRCYERRVGEGKVQQCRSVAVSDIGEMLRGQLHRYGVSSLSSARDSLRLVLAARASKVFLPSLADVDISFADGYGLYGEPKVSPEEVTLYGPEEALERITELRVSPTTIANLSTTASLSLPLDPVWERMGDVTVSTTSVAVRIPVQSFVERTYTLPLTVRQADTAVRLHLYPEQASVRVWVAQRDLQSVSADRFEVSVDYSDILAGKPHLKPRLTRFPECVRVRTLSPAEVQYVVIQ